VIPPNPPPTSPPTHNKMENQNQDLAPINAVKSPTCALTTQPMKCFKENLDPGSAPTLPMMPIKPQTASIISPTTRSYWQSKGMQDSIGTPFPL